jgi:plastocyanin
MNAARTAGVVAVLLLPWFAAAETHVVTIEGMRFAPETVTVRPGDKVVWRNKDVVPHTATAAGAFDSGVIAAGKSWSWTVRSKKKNLDYVCVYHPGMKASMVLR